jgi:hypothetical protein
MSYHGTTHNETFDLLQEDYLVTRDNNTLATMYEVAKEVAYNYLAKYCRSRSLHLDLEELSHDSSMYIIEQYLRKPEFRVAKLSAYIYFGVIKNLYKNKNREQKELSY